ncbi:putative TIM-barrel fold metal-dependent hydrolase [Roseiarcus fermentans]|uniref:Putative TIM-barrel fold metal-dependent hydrolase n=1 Tax=Roseiarcus fermentans TaxID=1473586 RepID=A0A366EW21_9HYPH|nr:amidohydrolase [Roseiarcus fermentans]RBP05685.1 putative TIM-barrel fold metal-dependent hydrolase [Roseiarcus fermentans]
MSSPTIIDTHLHLIYRDRLSYPWLGAVAALDRDARYERYAEEARRCGVGGALHMEVDVAEPDIEAESRNVEDLAIEGATLLRGAISACRPESPDFPAFLERALGNPFIKGFRRILHNVPDGLSERPIFRENVRRLSGTGRPFDLCVRPDQLDRALALIDACPDVLFVLDHCGAQSVTASLAPVWRARIADVARRPNVCAKISGVVAYLDAKAWTLADLRPYVEPVIERFGWDRVVWGSDWPVCTLTASLSIWLAATHALTRGASVDERDRLFAGNARRLWRIEG